MTVGKGKRSNAKRDFMQVARAVVEEAIGEHLDGTPLPPPPSGRRLAGAKGGKKGGAARAKVLTPAQRREIAVKAAQARWKTPKDD